MVTDNFICKLWNLFKHFLCSNGGISWYKIKAIRIFSVTCQKYYWLLWFQFWTAFTITLPFGSTIWVSSIFDLNLNILCKVEKTLKVAWIRSHYLHPQWKFKLWAGKFVWGVKAKHCWVFSTNFWKQILLTSPSNVLPY